MDDVVESLPELWETCLRVRDDIKESVRNAADLACKTLSRVGIQNFLFNSFIATGDNNRLLQTA